MRVNELITKLNELNPKGDALVFAACDYNWTDKEHEVEVVIQNLEMDRTVEIVTIVHHIETA